MVDQNVKKVGQNFKYDLVVFWYYDVLIVGVEFDIMIVSFVFDFFCCLYSMDVLFNEFLGIDLILILDLIGKGRIQVFFDIVDIVRVCEYVLEDVDIIWWFSEVLGE